MEGNHEILNQNYAQVYIQLSALPQSFKSVSWHFCTTHCAASVSHITHWSGTVTQLRVPPQLGASQLPQLSVAARCHIPSQLVAVIPTTITQRIEAARSHTSECCQNWLCHNCYNYTFRHNWLSSYPTQLHNSLKRHGFPTQSVITIGCTALWAAIMCSYINTTDATWQTPHLIHTKKRVSSITIA